MGRIAFNLKVRKAAKRWPVNLRPCVLPPTEMHATELRIDQTSLRRRKRSIDLAQQWAGRQPPMSGIFYGLSVLGVFLIIRWFVRNDGRETTVGLLAMRRSDSERK